MIEAVVDLFADLATTFDAEPATLATLVLLAVATIAGLIPGVPGGLIATAAIVGHWYVVGVLEPAIVAVLALIALLTGLIDIAAGIVAGDRGGASRLSITVGVTAGVVGLLTLSFIGLVLGMVGGVFAVEFLRERDKGGAFKASVYSMIGILASNVLQAFVLLVVSGVWFWIVVLG